VVAPVLILRTQSSGSSAGDLPKEVRGSSVRSEFVRIIKAGAPVEACFSI
jgi:hypothetical protein